MSDNRPLDIFDLMGVREKAGRDRHPALNGEYWFWCRYHKRAESVDWTMFGCVRVGPFMTEHEANRLSDDGAGAMGYTHDNPLGMEVEP